MAGLKILNIRNRCLIPLALALSLTLAAGCGGSSGDGEDAADATSDLSADVEVTQDVEEDAPVEVDTHDWLEDGPNGQVFWSSPAVDDETTTVPLTSLTDPEGRLTGDWVQVFNCFQRDDIEPLPLIGIRVCAPEQTVLPDEDGSYLHVAPPEDLNEMSDPFAEVQMYFHVTRVHDFFKGTLGVTHMDWVMPAIVNISMDNGGGWEVFDNAAFMGGEGLGALGFDMDAEGGAIAFGQGSAVDFSYDTSVIYHEYTHATIGDARLQGNTADQWGLSDAPLSINEASADYFASTILNDPVLGRYALADFDAVRDLTELRTCPADLVGEAHYDGRIWGSALWDIHESLGAEAADDLIFRALMQYGQDTTFREASQVLLDEAALDGDEALTAVTEALSERNLIDCLRVKPFADAAASEDPLFVPGKLTAMVDAFTQVVPMAYQLELDVPDGAEALELSFRAGSSGMMGMGWQGTLDLRLAVRADEMVSYEYPKGKAETIADVVLEPVKGERADDYTVLLKGGCLAADKLYLHLQNRTVVDVVFRELAVAVIEDASALDDTCP
jgi:hypothetical protein